MPAPATGFHTFDPAFTDLGSKYRPEPMPPISDGFMADINAPFMEQIFHITKGQRKPDIQHHGQADNLTARFEVAEGRAFCHRARLRNRPAQLKRVSSDSAIYHDQPTCPATKNGKNLQSTCRAGTSGRLPNPQWPHRIRGKAFS